jgi:hypothetical protein
MLVPVYSPAGLAVTWHDFFEPQGVAAVHALPPWDERFRQVWGGGGKGPVAARGSLVSIEAGSVYSAQLMAAPPAHALFPGP